MFRTLRARLLFASTSIFSAMLLLLLWDAQTLVARAFNEQIHNETEQLRPLLKAAIGPLLVERDYATLNEVLKEALSDRGLAEVTVLDSAGRIIATAASPTAPRATLAASMPLMVEGQTLGEVRFGVRTDAAHDANAAVLRDGLVVGVLLLLLGATLLALTTARLTADVERLALASQRLAAGEYDVKLPASPVAEIRRVGDAFNHMVGAVQAQVVALRDSDRFRRSVIASLAEGLVVHDRDGRVTEINESAERLLGSSRADLLGADPARLWVRLEDAEGREIAPSAWPAAQALEEGESQRGRLVHVLLHDGRGRWLQIHAEPIFKADEPAPVAAVCTFADMSPRVDAERRLRLNNEELERRVAERTEQLQHAKEAAEEANRSKSEFLSRMSHELRTPLNAILGFSQLLAMPRSALAPSDKLRAEQIAAAGWHLLELINEVLDLSRIEAGAMSISTEVFDLAELIREALAMMQMQAEARGVRLIERLGAQPLWTRADRTRVKQVLNNLLSNAVKYNRPGGHVIVTVATPTAARHVVDITDSGRGFTAEQLGQLYTPFTRFEDGKEVVQGTGIGLVITRRLVELMGGQLRVESTAGVGTRFSFDLQSADAPTALAMTPHAVALRGLTEPAALDGTPAVRLLYVEDNPSNVELMRQVIALHPGYRLEVANDGLAGWAAIVATPPDLGLIDVDLPGIDGVELCRRIRAEPRLAGLPLIALSANAMAVDVNRARRAGFDAYLTKPLDMARLFGEIERVLGRNDEQH